MAYVYLASPYSDKSELVRHKRYLQVSEVVVQLLNKNISVYSPIVHCHELAKRFSLPKDFNFWKRYNCDMLEKAVCMYILELPGWSESKGVQGEIQFSLANNLPITNLPYPLEEIPCGAKV